LRRSTCSSRLPAYRSAPRSHGVSALTAPLTVPRATSDVDPLRRRSCSSSP
jgi:hypothetical protein